MNLLALFDDPTAAPPPAPGAGECVEGELRWSPDDGIELRPHGDETWQRLVVERVQLGRAHHVPRGAWWRWWRVRVDCLDVELRTDACTIHVRAEADDSTQLAGLPWLAMLRRRVPLTLDEAAARDLLAVAARLGAEPVHWRAGWHPSRHVAPPPTDRTEHMSVLAAMWHRLSLPAIRAGLAASLIAPVTLATTLWWLGGARFAGTTSIAVMTVVGWLVALIIVAPRAARDRRRRWLRATALASVAVVPSCAWSAMLVALEGRPEAIWMIGMAVTIGATLTHVPGLALDPDTTVRWHDWLGPVAVGVLVASAVASGGLARNLLGTWAILGLAPGIGVVAALVSVLAFLRFGAPRGRR